MVQPAHMKYIKGKSWKSLNKSHNTITTNNSFRNIKENRILRTTPAQPHIKLKHRSGEMWNLWDFLQFVGHDFTRMQKLEVRFSSNVRSCLITWWSVWVLFRRSDFEVSIQVKAVICRATSCDIQCKPAFVAVYSHVTCSLSVAKGWRFFWITILRFLLLSMFAGTRTWSVSAWLSTPVTFGHSVQVAITDKGKEGRS